MRDLEIDDFVGIGSRAIRQMRPQPTSSDIELVAQTLQLLWDSLQSKDDDEYLHRTMPQDPEYRNWIALELYRNLL